MKSLCYISIWILFGLYLIYTNNLFAQLSPYHTIVFPYDNPNKAVYSAGNLTYASADFLSNIHSNPVSFSYAQKPQIFLMFDQEISKYRITNIQINETLYNNVNKTKEANLNSNHKLYLGLFACTFPLKVTNRRIFLSASLVKIQTPEHEVWLTSKESPGLDPELDFLHQRDGHVWNSAINIGYQLPLNINLGITWSKWFGSWFWHDYNLSQSIIGEGKFKYGGNNFSIGFLKKFKDISIAFSYFTPLTLMKADDSSINNMGEMNYSLQQKFNGAFKLGFAFQLNDKTTLSFGYRYQNKFSMKRIVVYPSTEGSSSREEKHEYSSSHQIAISYEYVIQCRRKSFPIFLAYWADWLPKGSPDIQSNVYQNLSIDDYFPLSENKLLPDQYENITIGAHFPFYFLNIHLSGQLSVHPIKAICLQNNTNTIPPPLKFETNKIHFIRILCKKTLDFCLLNLYPLFR